LSIDTETKIICLNRHSNFSIRWSVETVDINPHEQMKLIENKLLNTTHQTNFCRFQMSINHDHGRFQVSFENRSHYAPSDEVLRTILVLNSPNPWYTTLEGICWTNLCDRQRILNTARWILFESRIYLSIRPILNQLLIQSGNSLTLRQCYKLEDKVTVECHASKCLALNEMGNHIPKCLESPGDPLINIRTLIDFREKTMSIIHEVQFICTKDFCNNEEMSDEILRLTRKEFGMMSIWNFDQNFQPSEMRQTATANPNQMETMANKDVSTIETISVCPISSFAESLRKNFVLSIFSVFNFVFVLFSE